MSSSPKYTTIREGTERLAHATRVRAERRAQRKAREREARRRAQEAERRAAVARVAAMAERAAAAQRAAAAAGVAAVPPAVQTDLQRTRQAAQAADDREALAHARAAADQAERAIIEARARAAAAARQQVADRVDAVAALLAEVSAEVRTRYDRDGAEGVEELLGRARRRVAADPAEGARWVDGAAQAVREHVDRVLARRSEHEARVTVATAAVGDVEQRLEVLYADAVETGVQLPHLTELRDNLGAARAALAGGDLPGAVGRAGQVSGMVDAAEQELDVLIDKVIERRQLLRTISAALPEAGFRVDPSSLREGPGGVLELHAHSGAGQQFAVLLRDGADGATQVLYTTDAAQEAVAVGRGESTCKPLLKVIDQLSERARQDGFEPGPVRWDGDDRPPSHDEVELPGKVRTPRTRSAR